MVTRDWDRSIPMSLDDVVLLLQRRIEVHQLWADWQKVASPEQTAEAKKIGGGELASHETYIAQYKAAIKLIQDKTQRDQELQKALDLAVGILSKYEPPDSRAVSDEFVAMAAVSVGEITPEVIRVLDMALAAIKVDHGMETQAQEIKITYQ